MEIDAQSFSNVCHQDENIAFGTCTNEQFQASTKDAKRRVINILIINKKAACWRRRRNAKRKI
jgi:hypothetical protein